MYNANLGVTITSEIQNQFKPNWDSGINLPNILDEIVRQEDSAICSKIDFLNLNVITVSGAIFSVTY